MIFLKICSAISDLHWERKMFSALTVVLMWSVTDGCLIKTYLNVKSARKDLDIKRGLKQGNPWNEEQTA